MLLRSCYMAATALTCLVSLPALAADCGPPPSDIPVVPEGASATGEQLRDARTAVQAHSEAVTKWIECKDTRARLVFTWMTEEQQNRWNEDINDIHNARVELERQVNDQIRAFNQRNNSR